jgi:hypothetical protein
MTASLERQAHAPRVDASGESIGALDGACGARRSQPERTPDFFIVGNPKSGTTALYEMLRRHPQIFMSAVKEPHFLAAEEPPPSGLPRTLEEYLALFAAARPDQRAGEASPSYLRSPVAARRIAELQPHARIVAILREPASFVRSLHMQYLQDHVERERDLRRALARERIVRDGRTILRYSERVRYVEQLRRYHELFGREQVLVLIYEDFRADNAATVRSVLRFLEVDDSVAIAPLEANPTVRMRSVRLARIALALRTGRGPLGRALHGPITALTSERMRAGAMGLVRRRVLYGEPQPSDEGLMEELRRHFAPEVVALSEYLGRDLVAEWGYERVG